MDRYAIEFPHLAPAKDPQDPLSDTLQKRGYVHEEQLEASFGEQGLSVIHIEGGSNNEKQYATLSAMNKGTDIIAQARLEMAGFMGFADFLVKVPGNSNLGTYHYEVWDTKLSKHLKPTHVIQLCCYAEMLETIQGVRPKNITVVLGDGEKKSLRTNDYFQYYLRLKESFLDAQENFDPTNIPDPSNYQHWGDWSNYAESILVEKDLLFQVANITRGQIKKLNMHGIWTMHELANTTIDRVPGIHSEVFQRLKKQASIQKESIEKKTPLYEIIVPQMEEKQGLALLPPSSPLDVFFDIEGFPLHEDGLEYLWGCTYFNDSGKRDFKDFWAHDREEEKQAFESFIHWVYKRWQQDPSMHIYHYANYEIAACRKLMGRFGVCEEEVDQLLRNEVFVDLYKIVKGSLIVGEPRYSIKNIEQLYRDKRETDVGSGGDSVVAYENWRELHSIGLEGKTWEDSTILKGIRDYNIDDCNSTQELVDWLREKQRAHNIPYLGKTEVQHPEVKEEVTERTLLRDRLLEKAKSNPTCKNQKLTENLAWILEFHRRESKPVFWKLFDRLGLSHQELLDDADCLAFCQRTTRSPFLPTPSARNYAYEYRFNPNQDFKGVSKQFYLLGEEDNRGNRIKVTYLPDESDLENGLVVVQSKEEPKPLITLIPDEHVNPKPIPNAIHQFVTNYEAGRIERCAIIDFLNRSTPSLTGHQGGPIITSTHPDERLEQIIQAVENLDNSYLTIQGPPGSGKSYTAKHVIARLLEKGCKVGISSNSHKAINHLLLNTARYCNHQGIKASFVCTKETDEHLTDAGIIIRKNNELSSHTRGACALGTTAWGFARDDMVDRLDYLFIDEAGQVSVANLIAMSRCAKNLVLMGDQMQLGQPIQGSHPAESGLSILDYLLHETPTISDEMGIFLGTTYRMHPAVNHFISENIYEGKLFSHPTTEKRVIKIPDGNEGKLNKEAGIIFIPVYHEGNTQASEEEVGEIQKLTRELLSRTLTMNNGSERLITWDDILFVSPYNYQCRKLREALGPQAKVGSVDKFQGQEAPVVILSMCTSDASESPRGLEFLLNKNRINVAISRAQTLAIVVGNPEITNTSANNVQQVKLINLFNHFFSYKN